MQFIVTCNDGKDDKALDRRMAARPDHLKQAKKLCDKGNWLYAVAILNDAGKMAGSVIICEFPSKQAFEEEWLKNEPFVLGNVWETIDIKQVQVAPFCANLRDLTAKKKDTSLSFRYSNGKEADRSAWLFEFINAL